MITAITKFKVYGIELDETRRFCPIEVRACDCFSDLVITFCENVCRNECKELDELEKDFKKISSGNRFGVIIDKAAYFLFNKTLLWLAAKMLCINTVLLTFYQKKLCLGNV